MKKQLLTLLTIAFVGIFSTAKAQMTAGCIAPNFIASDINGTQWNLYDILATGKPVYIDVSATWCSPCWNYHNSGALENLYNSYGPQGTNELMVFFVEGDAATTNADLHGTGSNTQGDWVTGTPYPIIDDATIANDLEISYFPTIYLICPDRIIREVGQLTTAQLYSQRTTCPVANQANANDAGLTNSNLCLNPSLASCSNVDIACRIANYGTSPLTSATLTLTVGGTAQQTINWTGNLATYETEVYTFTGVTGVTGTNSVSIAVSSPNGQTDPTATNNTRTASFLIYPSTGGAAVSEAYAAATFPPASWNLINGGDAATWSRSTAGLNGAGSAKMDFWTSPQGDVDALQLPAMDLSGLQDASMTFDIAHARYNTSNDNLKVKVSADCGQTWTTVFNKTGAALSTTTASTTAFTPTTSTQWRSELVALAAFVNNSNLFVKFEANSGYGNNLYVDNVNITFTTGLTTVTKTVAFEMYPNPASAQASVDINLDRKDDVTVEIFNKVGAFVYSRTENGMSAGEHSFTINTSDFAKGIYMVSVKTSIGATQKKLVVE
ncbi:MAG TPA: T9SS type A sorting domain-containing protein [Bacteroidia bacterium]|nr:T9SS type A sorting domain-containing protein [Bacteroidia bacterium]